MSELIEALNQLEKEKDIDKEVIIEAIEASLLAACKRDFGKSDNIKVSIDQQNRRYGRISRKRSRRRSDGSGRRDQSCKSAGYFTGISYRRYRNVEITPKNFGRIAAQHARSVIVQKIKEEERKVIFNHFYCKEKDIVTGVVQRYVGDNISISLDDKTDALLTKNEQVKAKYLNRRTVSNFILSK